MFCKENWIMITRGVARMGLVWYCKGLAYYSERLARSDKGSGHVLKIQLLYILISINPLLYKYRYISVEEYDQTDQTSHYSFDIRTNLVDPCKASENSTWPPPRQFPGS